MTTQQFIEEIAYYIKKYAPKYGIKVISPIIAQALLESANGTSELAIHANNFFGIKYNKGRCPTSCGIYYKMGAEQNSDGTYKNSAMQWCKFKNIEDCVIGYFDFINVSWYYNLKGITNPKTYLETIKKDGYATSLDYVNNVYKRINQYNLTKYDKETTIVTKPATSTSTQKLYRVQCGAYKNKANAELLKTKLAKAGYPNAIIKQVDNLYKVQVGAFSNQTNAQKFKNEISSKGFNAFIAHN